MKLSTRANLLKGQEMFKILAQVNELERKGKHIIHLELGDPDFDTPLLIRQSAKVAIDSGVTHYAPSQGRWELLNAAQEVTERSRGFKPELNQLLVTAGANVAIYYALACICDPGDEVIVSDPCFVSYISIMKWLGIKIVTVPLTMENKFKLRAEDVESKITKRTRAIIVNSPNNPCGSVLDATDTFELFSTAVNYNLMLISDEIYARMTYEQNFSSCAWDKCKSNVVVINGFSKSYAMTGWRLGVTTGPKKLINKMSLLLETTSSCVNPFVQLAGVTALLGNQDDTFKMIKEYKERRNLLVDGLNEIKGIDCLQPQGAFYVFPDIHWTGLTSTQFVSKALAAGVALVPGNVFGKNGEGFVRLCYANSKENIIIALERLKKVKP